MIYTIGLALLAGLALMLLFMWTGERKERILWQREAKRRQEEAARDELTGLPNRRALVRGSRRMHDALARAAHRGGLDRELLVVVMDVHRFKEVNDTCGHAAGDELLKELAAALADVFLRPTDLVGRLGGDEFAAILELSADESGIEDQMDEIKKSIRARLDQIHRVDVGLVACGFSTGSPIGLGEAWKEADAQMYAAKKGKKEDH